MIRLRQLVRYGAVSVIASTVSMIVLGILVTTRLTTPGWANIVATAVGTVPSFELNRRWVWKRRGRRRIAAQVGPFCILSLAGLGLSTTAVSIAGRWATSLALSGTRRTALVEAANVAAFASLWVVQFVVLDRLLFKARPEETGEVTARPGPADERPRVLEVA